ncbi:hypothetical protein BDQ12DRAFT_670378 [Crucibulum laeve]|uniref:Uncharacterized protein n=1 Tax=Crucibulum laeve TaxID=68775 RepID=A0A5C3LMS8_9AGAR|nr:hypothetical protein BDQ12DRAFT_670378 [Crucibulum laeve]
MFKLSNYIVFSFFATAALAGNICSYTTRDCVTGIRTCCNNIAEGTCCSWSSTYGWAVKFENMPLTSWWLGRTYGDTCRTSTSGGGSSGGSTCVTVYPGPNYLNWKSANWDADTRSRRSVDNTTSSVELKCAIPNVVEFNTQDGEAHSVTFTADQADHIHELVDAGKLEELLDMYT